MTEKHTTYPFIRKSQPQIMLVEIASRLLMTSLTVEGRQNLERAQELTENGVNLIIVSNHISNADAPVLDRAIRESGFGGFADELVFIQGIKLDEHPINKRLIGALNVIKVWPQGLPATTREEQVERRQTTARASRDAKKSLEDGYRLVIFPEGGRSYAGSLKHTNASAIHFFKLSQDRETFALPVGIWGTEKAMPPGKMPRPTPRVHVNFGELINMSLLIQANGNLKGEEMQRAVIDELMRKGIAPLLPPQYRGVYGKN